MQDSTEIKLQSALEALRDEQSVRGRLAAIVKRKRLKDVCIGVWDDGRTMMPAAGYDAAVKECVIAMESARDTPIVAGCLAKQLTGALVSDVVEEGRIGWSDSVGDVLACDVRSRRLLHGIAVHHLLDHTHGLDASMVAGLPHRADGFIDVNGLCSALDTPPLCAPGSMYSYDHVGAWLAAAVLERVRGTSYASQLREHRLISSSMCDGADTICPATGADLALSVEEWLAFAQRSIARHRQTPDEAPQERKLPGWHPVERAICRGWKSYGEGWIGHNANLSDRSAMLRMNVQNRLAIMVSARDTNGALFAASGVFGDLLPEFRNLRPPRLLTPTESGALSLQNHVARYVQARTAVQISMDSQGTLHLCVQTREPDAMLSVPRRLQPTREGVFLAELGGSADFLFVQFIGGTESSAPTHLWNGRQVWRREEVASE